MSEISATLDELEWADPEDRVLAERDAALFGNAYVIRGANGLARRIEPTRIRGRWDGFEVGELQQLLLAVGFARRARVISEGPGNLLERMEPEVGAALNARIRAEEP